MSTLKNFAKKVPFVLPLARAIRRGFRASDYLPPLKAEKALFVDYVEYRRALMTKEAGHVVLKTHDGLRIAIRRNKWDARIVREMFFEKPYIQYCKLGPNPVVVDIGGYIGDFAIYCAKYFDAGRVIVYEPTRENLEMLQENVRLNGFGSRIEVVGKAVGVSGELVLNIEKKADDEVHASSEWYKGAETRRIPSVSIAELYAAHGLTSVDLLKIDCEGGEYHIIPEMPEAIMAITKNITFEYHRMAGFEEKVRVCMARLEAAGYELHKQGVIVSACKPAVGTVPLRTTGQATDR